MTPAHKCYLLAAALLLAAPAALAIDVPVAAFAREDRLPGDLRKLLTVSEVFAHGLGVLLILATVLVLDPAGRHRVPRVAACAYLPGALALLAKQLIPRVRPAAFDLSQPAWEAFAAPGRSAGELAGYAIESFPSGHTATAVGLAIGLAWCYPRGRWLFALFAFLAAAQRVESSAHFVSDTFVGAAIACLIAGSCIDPRLCGKWFSRLEQRRAKRLSASDRAGTLKVE